MPKNFWKNLPKPIIALAPMDGYSDSALRRICKEVNPGIITYTEFTSADGLKHNAKKLIQKLHFHNSEQPIIAQIFGKNPESYITAAKICEDMGFSGIDINMGCPARKVVNSEHGIALRNKPELALKLIETLANASNLAISVKTRLGWHNADGLITFCQAAVNAGADQLCIHGRTYKEPYNVPAQWEPIYELKKNLAVPVIGNGGITSYQNGMELLSNLDGFMIGQAAFGNPWVFSPKGAPLTFTEKVPIILHHAEYLIENKGEEKGTREIRKHLLNYIKGFNRAKEFRKKIVSVESLADIKLILNEIINICISEVHSSLEIL